MNGQFDEELLSAYHDGELDEAERKSVTDRLAENSEQREIVDDYAELANSLKSLPRSQAPPDFRAAVMRDVQGTSSVQPHPETSQPNRRQALLWAAGTAASLLIVAGLFQLMTGPGSDRAALTVAEQMSDSAAMEAAPMEMATTSDLEEADFGGNLASRAEASLPEAAAVDSAMMLDSPTRMVANDPQLQELLRSLPEEPDVGQELEMLDMVGDELVLIEFQVVNVVKTYGDFQVLLNEIGIRPLNGEFDDATAEFISRNRLRGIFVEASNEELLAALSEIDLLQNVVLVDTNGVDVALELGVNRDEIPDRMQSPVGFAGGRNQAVAQAEAAELPAGPSRAGAPPAADAAGSNDEEAQGDSATGAYQMQLSLSESFVQKFEQRQRQRDGQESLEQPVDPDSNNEEQDPQDDARPNENANRTRSRFLLIFVTENDASDD